MPHASRTAVLAIAIIAVAFLSACATEQLPTSTPSGTPSPAATATEAPTLAPSPPVQTPSPFPNASPTAPASPPASPATPAPSPAGGVDSPAQAAAQVLASEPQLFYGIGPVQPDLIGQCCWYQALPAVDGYAVTVEIGWGDCPSGCISRHTWLYSVARDGTRTLLEETGDEPVQRDDVPPGGPGGVLLEVLAGPVCPVEPFPPDPACAPRPVAGAEMVLFDSAGLEIGRGLTDGEGRVALTVEPGAYYIEPQPVEGLMGTPEAIAFSAYPGAEMLLRLNYDTGIR
jgi:hypothetical protein